MTLVHPGVYIFVLPRHRCLIWHLRPYKTIWHADALWGVPVACDMNSCRAIAFISHSDHYAIIRGYKPLWGNFLFSDRFNTVFSCLHGWHILVSQCESGTDVYDSTVNSQRARRTRKASPQPCWQGRRCQVLSRQSHFGERTPRSLAHSRRPRARHTILPFKILRHRGDRVSFWRL